MGTTMSEEQRPSTTRQPDGAVAVCTQTPTHSLQSMRSPSPRCWTWRCHGARGLTCREPNNQQQPTTTKRQQDLSRFLISATCLFLLSLNTTQHNTTHLDSMTSGDTSCSVRLFVGGVSTCGEELLKQRFSSFGTVQDVELVAGKPFAYVTLAAPDISQRVSRCM
jgi:hypothetical protein